MEFFARHAAGGITGQVPQSITYASGFFPGSPARRG